MVDYCKQNDGTNNEIVDLEPMDEHHRRSHEPEQGTLTVTHIVYGLHTISILIGFVTAGLSVAGAFVFSAPSILAVIINYIFRSDARGTYLDSHFSWQIRTFWYALLWIILIFMISIPLVFFGGMGFFTTMIGFLVLGVWVAYRILYGWKQLAKHEAMPLY